MSEFISHMEEEKNMTATETVKVYEDGIGVVAPTGEVSDQELIEAGAEAEKPVEDHHVVCIDERPALDKQPVREKMSGGNVATGFVAARLARWTLFGDELLSAPAEAQIGAVADHLVEAGEGLGGHTDNHAPADGSKSNCGAADGLPKAFEAIANHGRDAQFESQMKDVLGELYDQAVWEDVIANAAADHSNPDLFAAWRGTLITDAVKQRGGVVEVLNGDNTRPKMDPDNLRHNHWAEGVKLGFEENVSNDRDNAAIPHFRVDVPAIIRTCQKMSTGQAEFTRLLHAAAGYQFAVRFLLTKGQRNF